MLIANNCCASDVYNSNHIQYNHPFMWCLLMYQDIIELIDNWTTINYASYELYPSIKVPDTFILRIDNKINVQYVHYFNRPNMMTPTRFADRFHEMRHIGYYNIKQYIVDKYTDRTSRMKGLPAFIIHLNKNTWQCDINESNVEHLIQKCEIHKFPIFVFGKATLPKYNMLFHVNEDFKYPYEVKDFINTVLPNMINFA